MSIGFDGLAQSLPSLIALLLSIGFYLNSALTWKNRRFIDDICFATI